MLIYVGRIKMSRNHPIPTLYVRNISDRVRSEDITRLFERYGRIVDIRIPIDYNSRTSRGFAFVQFEDVGDAEEAMYKLDKKMLLGREIEVEFARFDRKNANEMRNRGSSRKDYRDSGRSNGNGHYNDRRTRSRERRDRQRRRSRERSATSHSSRSHSNERTSHKASRTRNRRSSRSLSKNRSPHHNKDKKNKKVISKERSRTRSGSPKKRNNLKRSNSRNNTPSPQPTKSRRHESRKSEENNGRSQSPLDD